MDSFGMLLCATIGAVALEFARTLWQDHQRRRAAHDQARRTLLGLRDDDVGQVEIRTTMLRPMDIDDQAA